jgi:hypothetical protein
LRVERLGSALVVLVTILTLVSLGVYGSLKAAVGDLHAQASILRAELPPPSRPPFGQAMSALFTSDIAPADKGALDARTLELDHRADRLLELTAVVALLGLLAALITGRPAVEPVSVPLNGTRISETDR